MRLSSVVLPVKGIHISSAFWMNLTQDRKGCFVVIVLIYPTFMTTTPTESSYIEVNSFLEARGLKVFHQNINGFLHELARVELMMKKTINKSDILGITETHLHEGILDKELEVDGYTFIRKDRKNGEGGGIGCSFRTGIYWQKSRISRK